MASNVSQTLHWPIILTYIDPFSTSPPPHWIGICQSQTGRVWVWWFLGGEGRPTYVEHRIGRSSFSRICSEECTVILLGGWKEKAKESGGPNFLRRWGNQFLVRQVIWTSMTLQRRGPESGDVFLDNNWTPLTGGPGMNKLTHLFLSQNTPWYSTVWNIVYA